MNKKNFLKNSMMLTLWTLLLRIVFTAFRVNVSNIVGAECMGLYSLSFTVFNFATTVACSGINFAATRILTQTISQGGAVKSKMASCIKYALCFSGLSMVFLLLFARKISTNLLCDLRSVPSIRAFAISLPFISVSSAISGYFFASRRVGLSVFSRVLEITVQITSFYIMLFAIKEKNIENFCLIIVLSSVFSEIASCLFLIIAFKVANKAKEIRENSAFADICKIALPSAFAAYLKTALQMAENLLIPISFRKYGASAGSALAGYGLLSSMVMPILFFPSFVLSSFSMLLIPEYTEAQVLNKNKDIKRTTEFTLKLTLFFSLIVSSFFVTFGEVIGKALYNNSDAGRLIKIMALLIPFMYLDSVADGMLKGLGEYTRVVTYSSIDTVLSIILIVTLVSKSGLIGYIIVIYSSTVLNSTLSILRILKVSGARLSLISDVISPLAMATAIYKAGNFFAIDVIKLKSAVSISVFGIVFGVILLVLCFALLKNNELFMNIRKILNFRKEKKQNAKCRRVNRKIQI